MCNNNIIFDYESQVKHIFEKLYAKKTANLKVIDFLEREGNNERSRLRLEDARLKIEHLTSCANNIGVANIDGIAHIVKADFCRERICNICAWRRQAKFVSQTRPVLNILANKNYKFLFATLTIKNMPYEDLSGALDVLMKAFHKLTMRRQIKRAFEGLIRSVELTYNEKTDTFHPHIHLLIAVKEDYFYNHEKYISQGLLTELWKDCLSVGYDPIVHIETVNDTERAQLETLKYALKPSQSDKALRTFLYILKGRRLVSFSGIFAKVRKDLMMTDFEDNLLDDMEKTNKKVFYDLYKLDITGGIYKFYERYELNE